ncbi:MAG: 3-deoxy-7-phosphoheptulonate synthase [Planctomycetota bacterium]
MIFILRPGASPQDRSRLITSIEELGFRAVDVSEPGATAIAAIGGIPSAISHLQSLPCVERTVSFGRPWRQVGRSNRREDTIVYINKTPVGAEHFIVIAGPCAVENETQLKTIAQNVKDAGAAVLRGGAFKPRTSPYSFQGLGLDGLKLLRNTADELDLAVVTEALDPRQVETVARYADAIQIGSRSSQNFPLLVEAGRSGKPVLLKRGMAQTLKELLLSAEYILNAGGAGVILCERGVRNFDTEARNLLDINAVPALQSMTHLPVIVDPSHATGRSEFVASAAKAAVAAGSNGLMIEVHHDPCSAASDGRQALVPAEFVNLMEKVERILEIEGKTLSAPVRRP